MFSYSFMPSSPTASRCSRLTIRMGSSARKRSNRREGLACADPERKVVDNLNIRDTVELTLDELRVVFVEPAKAEGRILGGKLPAIGGRQVVPLHTRAHLEDVRQIVGLLRKGVRKLGVDLDVAVVVEEPVVGEPHAQRVGSRVVGDGWVEDGVAAHAATDSQWYRHA